MRYTYLFLLFINACLCSCKKDKQETTPPAPEKILGIYKFNAGNILSAVQCNDGRLMVLSQTQFPLGLNTITGIDEKGKLWFKNNFEEEHVNQYNGIAEGPDQGIILAGGRRFGLPSSLGLFHFDKNGQKLWELEAGFTDPNDQFKLLIRTHDGNYMALDRRNFSVGNVQQMFVWFSPDGTVLRTRQINVTGEMHWYDITETADHGYLCIGQKFAIGPAGGELAVIKFSEQGAEQWRHILQGTGSIALQGIALDDGGAIVCGRMIYTDSQDALLVRLSATGEVQWQKAFPLAHYASFDDIVHDGNGGYTLVTSLSDPGTSPRIMMMSVSADGTEQWSKSYDIVAAASRIFRRGDGGYTILVNDILANGSFSVLITDKDGNIE